MHFQPRLSALCMGMLTAAALLASSASLAANYKGDYKNEAMPAPCVQPLMLKDGFYLGAQVGYDSYLTRANRTATINGVTFTGNPMLAGNGFVGGIFGGYGMYFNNLYYLAGELFVNGSTVSNTYSVGPDAAGTSASDKLSVGASWGVSVLPGLKLNDSSLGYIRLGYESANLTGKSSYTVAGVTNSSNPSKWQSGFEYGVGLETAVYQNVSVRAEYNHTGYNSYTNNVGTKFSPSDNQFMLGLNYHFA